MGGGIGMGNTCKPMAVLFQCMTKFTTKKKKKNYSEKKKEKKKTGKICTLTDSAKELCFVANKIINCDYYVYQETLSYRHIY